MLQAPRCRALVLLGVVFIGSAALAGGAGEPDLDDAVQALFTGKGFTPKMLPSRRSTLADTDPLVVQAQWELVRPSLEALYQQRLKLKERPDLRLGFLCVNDPKWQDPKQIRVVFRDPGREAIRRSLVATLRLPPRSFEALNEYPQDSKVVEIVKLPGRPARRRWICAWSRRLCRKCSMPRRESS